jgi:hypothetical protein
VSIFEDSNDGAAGLDQQLRELCDLAAEDAMAGRDLWSEDTKVLLDSIVNQYSHYREWISVSDRTPDPHQVVLAVIKVDPSCGEIQPYTTHAALGYDAGSSTLEWGTFPYGDQNLWCALEDETVTHWLTIPELPL